LHVRAKNTKVAGIYESRKDIYESRQKVSRGLNKASCMRALGVTEIEMVRTGEGNQKGVRVPLIYLKEMANITIPRCRYAMPTPRIQKYKRGKYL
jgi:hypothetical protein